MNSKKILTLFTFILLASLILSACAGGAVANSWAGITVVDETIYLSNNQNVFAINASDGKELWRFPAEPIRNAFFYAPPILGKDGQVYAGGYHKILYAISQGGQQSWAFEDAEHSYFAAALYDNETIYAPNGDGNLYALDTSGQLLWQFESKHGIWAAPIMTDQCLIQASMDHVVYCLDKNTGEVIWKSEDLGGAIVTAPEVGPAGELFVGTFGNEVVALDGQNGKILGRFQAGAWVWSSPLLYEGNLFFGDLNGNFYSIDAETFEKKWQIQPDTADKRQITGKPLAFDGKIYFGTETGNFYTVDAKDGSLLDTRTIGGKIFAGPVAAGELILLAPFGIDAYLIALDGNGNQKWSFTPAKQ